MPETRKALAKGEINEEHANTAADAAEQTSPAEADRALAKTAKARPADMFAKKARDWAGSKERESAKEKRTERQRSAREARVWIDADGMTCLLAKFDPLTGRQITGRLAEAYDRLWRADGGRDGRPDEVRTPEQRRADALLEMLLDAAQAGGKRPHPKHSVVVTLDYNRLARRDPAAAARISDGEPLPQSIVDMITCDSAIAGAVYGTDGDVMWQGRSVRLATDDQWIQLVARDGGCSGCGASPAHCEAHHVDYWEELGNTDIDRLVLLCPHDHHLIHSGSHVLIETDTGWQLIRTQAQRRPESWAA